MTWVPCQDTCNNGLMMHNFFFFFKEKRRPVMPAKLFVFKHIEPDGVFGKGSSWGELKCARPCFSDVVLCQTLSCARCLIKAAVHS